MQFIPVLAHGSLGVFDEVIFVSIAAIFLIMMGVSWFISRRSEANENTPDVEENPVQPDESKNEPAQGDQYRLP